MYFWSTPWWSTTATSILWFKIKPTFWNTLPLLCRWSSVWTMYNLLLSEIFMGKTFYCFCDYIAVKEILKYTSSTRQLRCWSQGLFGYKFAILHRAASMIKDDDGLSKYIDILIHRYLTQASHIRPTDIAQRPSAYSFDSFISCSNPCRITTSDITITTETSSIFSPLSIIHHSPIHFTSKSIFWSHSVPKPISNTLHHIAPPEEIIWLSFDLITTNFGSLLSLWSGGTVADLKFKTTLRNYRIASSFSPSTLPQYITLSHLLHRFKLFKNMCSSSNLETDVTFIWKNDVTA